MDEPLVPNEAGAGGGSAATTALDDGPGRPLRADAARNRQRVLAAATAVFARRGLEASLDDVAAAAGVGVGTVYRRFPNKEALIDALFDKKVDGILELARQAAAFEDPWEGFVHFATQAIEWQVANRGLREVLLSGNYTCQRAERIRRLVTPVLEDVIERAKAAGALRADFHVNDVPMLVTMLGAVADYVADAAPDLWRRYLGLILDGLVVQRPSTTPLGDAPTQAVVDAAAARCS